MAYQLKVPILKTVVLDFDDSGETTATYRQPARAQVAVYQQMCSRDSQTIYKQGKDNEVAFITPVTAEETRAVEVWLTMVDCNLLGADGKPLFTIIKRGKATELAMTFEDFWAAWGTITEKRVAEALWRGAMSVAPDWDPEAKNPESYPGGINSQENSETGLSTSKTDG